jgi:hypothetical protein
VPDVSGPLGELAAYFRNEIPLPAGDMVRLAAAARASGLRWPDIALACGPGPASRDAGEGTAAAATAMRVFRDIQHAAGALAGAGSRLAPLAWPCPGCGRQVSDVAPDGRPVHVEAGHGWGCARLARDQARDDEDRRGRLPRLVAWSEAGDGPLQRHRLARRFTDWCPRCGWHGYFDGWAATVRGNWARVVCDDCWADLSPAVTVTVTFYVCSTRPGRGGAGEPFAVIRQRARSDHGPPDAGQAMTWEPFWQWSPLLADSGLGGDGDIRQVSQAAAETVIRSLIGRRWPRAALALPWTASAYRAGGAG